MVSIPLAISIGKGNALHDYWSGDPFYTTQPYHEMVMHHKHRTQSKIYDYWGKEEYTGNYIMADVNIGSKLNIISGVRTEKNVTTYKAFTGLEGTLPHFSAAGADSLVTDVRENTHSFQLYLSSMTFLLLRYAKTKTLTRPNYTDILPFYHISV